MSTTQIKQKFFKATSVAVLFTLLGFGLNWSTIINTDANEDSINDAVIDVKNDPETITKEIELPNEKEEVSEPKIEEVVEEKVDDKNIIEPKTEKVEKEVAPSKEVELVEVKTNNVLRDDTEVTEKNTENGNVLEFVIGATELTTTTDIVKDLLDKANENNEKITEEESDKILEKIVAKTVTGDTLNEISEKDIQTIVDTELNTPKPGFIERALKIFENKQDGNFDILSGKITQGDRIIAENIASLSNEDGELVMTIAPPATMEKGQYTAEVNFYNPLSKTTETVKKDFKWGVLLFNSVQDRHLIGTSGEFHFGVLDGLGAPVCGGEVNLVITKPNGEKSNIQAEDTGVCGVLDSKNVLPDYKANVEFEEAGLYNIKSTTVVNGFAHNYEESFEVVTSAPYVVTREAATRLYPQGFAPMKVSVKFNTSYNGEIVDTLPGDFDVKGENRINGSWAEGETATIEYEYDAPDLSPYVYSINNNLSARDWQIANDRIVTDTNVVVSPANEGIDAGTLNKVVTFVAGVDFPVGSVVRDVNVITNFKKTGGTCAAPTTGNTFNNEIGISMTGPNSVATSFETTGNSGYAGNAVGGVVNVTWDEDVSTVIGSTPATGSFNPIGNLDQYVGISPFGNWTVAYQDSTGSDWLCIYNTSIVLEVEAPGVTIAQSGGTTTMNNEGVTDTFTAVLDTQPTANVVVDVTPANGQVSVSPSTLTFTSANWNVAQTITATAVNDLIAETVPYNTTINTTINTASTLDNNYDAVLAANIATVTASITGDNDTAGLVATQSGGTTDVTEGGATDTIGYTLNSQPASNVTVTLTPNAQVSLSSTTLTFTPANWNVAQNITVTAVNDTTVESTTHLGSIVYGVTSTDTFYNGLVTTPTNANITDNDQLLVEFAGVTGAALENATATFNLQVKGGVLATATTINVTNLATGTATTGTDFTFTSPTSITIPAGNYATLTNIAVTGLSVINDNSVEPNETIIFGIASTNNLALQGDADGNSTNNTSFTYTIQNDDVASVSVLQSGGTTNLTEGGATDDINIWLTSAPTANVTVTLTPSSQVSLSTSTLTFTPANWNVAQNVVVTAVNDVTVEGAHTGTIGFTTSSTDTNFNSLSISSVTANITDNDNRGYSLVSSIVNVNENGGTGTSTIVLTAQPQSNVVFNVASNNTAEVTVSPTTLTFTPANWNIAQTVTVTGINDSVVAATSTAITLSINTALTDDLWDTLGNGTIPVTIIEDDVVGVTVIGTDTNLAEPTGNNGTFSIVLTSQPSANVTIPLSSSDTTEGTLAVTNVVFTSANWNVPQVITMTVVDDTLLDGAISFSAVTGDPTSTDLSYDALTATSVSDVTMTTADNETAGIIVNVLDNSTGEDLTTATVQFKLASQPISGDVTIPLSISNSAEGTISVTNVVITNANWNTFQNVTITGVNDALDDGDILYNLVTGDPTSPDATYNALGAVDVVDASLTNVDNDTAGVTVSTTGGSNNVTEGGATDTVSYVLNAQPASNVTITLTPNAQVSLSTTTLTFTPANWNVAQNITITAVNDAIAEGIHAGSITGATTSTDTLFNGLSVATQAVSITDNDTTGVTVTQSGGNTTTSEAGTTDTLAVVLTSQPTANVTVTLTPDTNTILGNGGNMAMVLTFTPANWNVVQNVTVSAVNDATVEGLHNSSIAIGVGSTDAGYSSIVIPTVTNTITDNDTAGFTVSPVALTISEANVAGTFTVVLDGAPQSNVVINVSSFSTAEATVSPTTLTFTPANWNVAQTVTVTSVDDFIDRNDTVNITLTVNDASSDNFFDPLADKVVPVTLTDNDTVGMTVTESGGTTAVTEGGATDTISYVLTSQPLQNVSVALSTSTQLTLSTTVLTFTPANWNVAQVVTVTANNDVTVEGAHNATISHTITSTDALYNAVTTPNKAVAITDNDTATVVVSPSGITVAENAGTGTFTVVLGAQPISNVVIDLTSLSTANATVSPSQLTFTPANWNVVQTVTVTGVDDLVDANDSTSITVSVNDALSDNAFDPLGDQSVGVTLTDNDTAGVIVTPTTSTITEGGNQIFSIVLTSQPTSNVVLDYSIDEDSSASGNSLIFTPANWNTPQTVTVTASEDSDVVNDIISFEVSVNDSSSDNAFDPLTNITRTINVTDNDVPTVIVSPTGITINENGGNGSFTVVLGAQPTSNVVIDLTTLSAPDATVSPSQLTFTPANWNIPQTVTVTGVDDSVDANDTTSITVSVNDALSDNAFDPLADQSVGVTLTDNDTAGITVAGTGAVTEGGANDLIGYVLTSRPTANVTVTLDPGTQLSLSTTILTFTPSNWNTGQLVSVTALNDVTVEGAHNGTITHTVSSSDTLYNVITLPNKTITITDNDNAGFTVTPASLTINENGGTGTLSVVLTSQPLSDVVIDLTTNIAGEATLSKNTLTFTPANWNTAQNVTVTGVDDLIDRDDTVNVTAAINDTSSDNAFDILSDITRTITLTDNDTRGVIINSTGTVNTTEAGTNSNFTAVLNSQPTANVTINLSSSDITEGTVISTVTFTPTNWNTAQTITINRVDDLIDDGDIAYAILTTDVVSTDLNYNALTGGDVIDVMLQNIDNDTAGITITLSNSNSISESGTTKTIDYVLTSQPTQPVTITITPDVQVDLGNGAGVAINLTFTPANWNVAQIITTTAVDDNSVEGNHNGVLTYGITTTAPEYSALSTPSNTTLTITDNDTPNLNIIESAGSTNITEGGATDTLTYTLNSQPLSDVTITITPDIDIDLGAGAGTPITLTFTSANWNVQQTITVTAVNDNLIEGAHTGTIQYSFASTDTNYDNFTVADTTVALTDNDTAGFVVTTVASETLDEETSAGIYTVVLTAEPTTDVVIDITTGLPSSLTTSNPTLVFTPSNWNIPQTVNFEGVNEPNLTDEIVTVIFAINDGGSDDDFDSVPNQNNTVTLNDNDTAGITVNTTPLSIGENGGTAMLSVSLNAEPQSNVVITLTSANNGEATVSPATLTFTPANWNVPQTALVTGVNDNVVLSTSTNIILSIADTLSDDDFDSVSDISIITNIVEDDIPGINVVQKSNLTSESGGTATFSITLSSIPTSDVTIPLSVTDSTEGTVPASITITPANWNIPQIVTVTGVNDTIYDGAIVYTVVTGDPTSSDTNYDNLSANDVDDITITNQDDDPPGVLITVVDGLTGENGDTATIQFQLVSQIANGDSITIPLSLSDTNEGSLNGVTSITIQNADWNNPLANQITITGVDDFEVDGLVAYSLITGTPTTTDPLYSILTGNTIADPSLSNTDNDVAGVIINQIGSVDVTEGSTDDSYSITLSSQPTSDVTVTITPNPQIDLGASAGVAITLTFTPTNWNTAQTVTVNANNDNVAEGLHAGLITHAATSTDLVYNALPINNITPTITDNDTAGIQINQSGSSTQVTEGGTTDSYDVVLITQPTANVSVTITPDNQTDLGAGAGIAITLIFTPANWNIPQTVTVEANDDSIDEDNHTSTITHSVTSTDSFYNNIATANVIATIVDNDTAGVTIFTGSGFAVTEGGAIDTYTAVLNSQPLADVTITITPSDEIDLGAGAGVQITLTFTPGNWNIPQTITVTANDDSIAEGTHSGMITHSSTSTDPKFNSLVITDTTATVIDNDNAGVILNVVDSQSGEDGSTATVQFTLATQPTSDVTISLTSSDTTEGTVTSSITITPANWNNGAANTITITGVNDVNIDGNIVYTLNTDEVTSTDPFYDVLTGNDVSNATLTNIDNDVDTDGDGVPDEQEVIDGTSPTNPLDYKDTDGDGVPDYVEVIQGTNANDAASFLDTDGAGVPDYYETTLFPNSGLPATNPNLASDDNQDTDGDGVPDYQELRDSTNPLDSNDYKDTDGDKVPDLVETQQGTNPNNGLDYNDTDGDGVPNYIEIRENTDPADATDFKDSDGGGVPNYVETVLFPNSGLPATDQNVASDDNRDADGDGVPDYQELRDGTNPSNYTSYKDTDGDRVPDYIEIIDSTNTADGKVYKDSDGDGVPDYIELRDGTNPTDATSFKDTDGGGAPDYIEVTLLPKYNVPALDPNNPADDTIDTDGDSVPDYREILDGTNPSDPLDYKDTDEDGVPDFVEAQQGTDPNDINDYKDTDGDGVPDYIETRDGTDINNSTDYKDTDGDGVPDYIETVFDNTNSNDGDDFKDTDGGGVPNYIETIYYPNIGLPATDPNSATDDNRDTDGDTVPDYQEVLYNTGLQNTEDDSDKIPTSVENAGPNNGDSNDDGIPDYAQQNVASLINPVTGAYSTLVIEGGCEVIDGFNFVAEASLDSQDNNAEYFIGLHGFELECANPGDTANIKVIWDKQYNTSNWVYKKFNPTTNRYFFIDDKVTLSTENIAGTPKTITKYAITDGTELDIDGVVDARIIDPAGPVIISLTATDKLVRTGGQYVYYIPVMFYISTLYLAYCYTHKAKNKA
jgi:large repetitive protein